MDFLDSLHGLKAAELKEECRKRGLAVGGTKAVMIQRLKDFMAENEASWQAAAAAAAARILLSPLAAAAASPQASPEGEASAEKPASEAQQEEEQEAEPEQEPASAPEEPAVEQPAAAEQEPAAAAEAAAEAVTEVAAAMEQDRNEAEEAAPPKRASPPKAAPAAAAPVAASADVDLDYGEESDGEGAGAAPAPAAEEEQAERAKPEEGLKRKRASGAAQVGPSAEKALAAAVGQGSADRPSKVPRTGSGFALGNAEKGEAPAPEDVPEAAKPQTRALRIDGFVRPFTERQVRELLSETGQVLALWMPSIKTHCFCVMESKAQAEATRRATYQLQWPATNPKRLAPRYMSLAEAEAAIGNGAGNPDFRLKRVEEDGPEGAPAAEAPAAAPAAVAGDAVAAADRSQREWNREKPRSTSPPLEGVRDLREMLSRKASAGRSGGEPAAAPPAAGRDATRAERRPEGGIERRLGPRSYRYEEHPVKTLDELFKKTAAKPCIYWLPLSDEQVAEKKRKAAEAAAAEPDANSAAAS